jgi:hypothetical protein
MDFSAFSHGQIHSKLWLCQELEKCIKKPARVIIIGSWYNILGFLLLSRNSSFYDMIVGVDYNLENTEIANKICNFYMINNDQKIKNICMDANKIDFTDYDIVISTSTEDIETTNWFDKIKKETLLCLQSTNMTTETASKYPNWEIKNPNENMYTFKKKYHMSNILFEGIKEFDYGDLTYKRYMLIGTK